MKKVLSPHKRLIITAGVLAIGALAYTFLAPEANHKVLSEATQAPSRTVKIMPLGDSVTEGNEPELKNGYRLDLMNNLKGYSIDYVGPFKAGLANLPDHDVAAQSGACMRDYPGCSSSMYEKTADWIKTYQPDIVIMQAGVNDFCCGRQTEDPQIVRNMFRDWVDVVRGAKPDVYIVVIGMPQGFKTGIPFKGWLPIYVGFEQALGHKISYVPLDGTESEKDGMHPDLVGYKTLADRLAGVLRVVVDGAARREP